MTKKFKNKTVVITGASAGIGRATALEFAKHGANLGLISRNQTRLESLKKQIEDLGGKAAIFTADVAEPEKMFKAAKYFEEHLGPIEVWINNAMASVFSPVKHMEPAEFKRVTEVTYLGQVYGTLAVLKHMQARNRGTIVLVGTALAYRGIPLQSAYSAAKHAVQGFLDSLRSELLHDKSKIRVTMVQLPAHNTPQFDWVKTRLPNKAQPVPPIYQPEVAARGIAWAAKRGKREVMVGWPAVRAIWGNRLFPGLADKFLAKRGYFSQQTKEPDDPNRPHNLWQTVEGDFGVHGRFGRLSQSSTWPFWLTTHFGKITAVLVTALVILLIIF